MEIYAVIGRIILLGMIIVLMTFAGLVLVRYRQLWRAGTRPALPAHVWMVSASYYLLLAALASRPAADWRVIFWIPALILGILAMLKLMPRRK